MKPFIRIDDPKTVDKTFIDAELRYNINEIAESSIENLEISWVRGFNDLSCISKFPQLKTLLIENEIQLSKIQFDNVFPYLADVKIINCKNLDTVRGLKNLPKLNSLIISQTKLDFENFIRQELPKRLKHLGFYTNRAKIDREIKALLESKGYSCD